MTSVPSDDSPPPSAVAEAVEHRLSRPRRKRSHRSRRSQFLPVAAVAALVGLGGGAVGIGVAYLLVDGPAQRVERRDEADAADEFVERCEARVKGIDCGCLWKDARPAFLPDTRDAVLDLIAQREILPLRVQRLRTEKVLGPELGKMVWAAAYYCVAR